MNPAALTCALVVPLLDRHTSTTPATPHPSAKEVLAKKQDTSNPIPKLQSVLFPGTMASEKSDVKQEGETLDTACRSSTC